MKKFANYLKIHIILIFSIIFISIITFTIAGFLIQRNFINLFLAITFSLLLIYLNTFKYLNRFWVRYRNTMRLKKAPFLFINGIIIFLCIVLILIAIFYPFLFRRGIIERFLITSILSKIFIVINIFLLLIYLLLSIFLKLEFKKVSPKEEFDEYIYSDNPIKSEKQDILGRIEFVGTIYGEINNISNLNIYGSYVFGLYSHWGEGKTSIKNLLINKFITKDNYIIVDFDPWNFQNEEALQNSLYKHLYLAIEKKYIFTDLKRSLIKYKNLISFGFSRMGPSIKVDLKKESINDLRQRVESLLSLIKEKIIIFIDNVDRLSITEILLIFKIVRQNMNFNNIFFFLCFDDVLVADLLKDEELGKEYLEKIVQKPIKLPAIEKDKIDNFLFICINELLENEGYNVVKRKNFFEDFRYFYNRVLYVKFKTLRTAKRFLNLLKTDFPPIKTEVNTYDFVLLEFIKIFYPKIYDDIWENDWIYIPYTERFEGLGLSPFFTMSDDKKYETIKEHIEKVIEKEKIESDIGKNLLRELLQELFFYNVKGAYTSRITADSLSSERAEQRITHYMCFPKYFTLKVPIKELSDDFVLKTIDKWNSNTASVESELFKLQSEEKLLELLEKLLLFINDINKELALKLIEIITKKADFFSREGEEHFWNSEFSKATNLLIWLIDRKLTEEEVLETIDKTILKTQSITLAVEVVNALSKLTGEKLYNLKNIYNAQRLENLKSILSKRLDDYFIKGKINVFEAIKYDNEIIFIIYQWASNWQKYDGINSKKLTLYLESIFSKDINKFNKFIELSGQKREDELTLDINELKKVYDLSILKEIAQKYISDKKLYSEYKNQIKNIEMLYKLILKLKI